MKNSLRIFAIVGASVLMLFLIAYLVDLFTRDKPTLPYYEYNLSTKEMDAVIKSTQKVGEFSFSDQQGRTISSATIQSKIYVVDYFFAQCPGICKKMSSELTKVNEAFKDEPRFLILSHTSKPEEDSTSELMNYAQMYGVKNHEKWLFLRGDKKILYDMARSQYHIVNDNGDGGEDDFIHTERFVLIDQQGFIRGYYDGTVESEVQRMIGDIKKLLEV